MFASFTFALLLSSVAQAGTFSTMAWTDDATTGLAAGQTNWAYHFGDTVPVTINGVSVPGLAGPAASNAHFDLTGPTTSRLEDRNDLNDPGSSTMAGSFVYGGAPAVLTVKGLTAGQSYMVSLFSVGWLTPRELTFSSGGDSLVVNQNEFGYRAGLRVDYAFTADAATRLITIAPNETTLADTFHFHGLALRQTSGTGSLVVSNGFDSGTGSLRQGVAVATADAVASTITFDPAFTGPVFLSSEIVITDPIQPIEISAASHTAGIAVNGNNLTSRVFSITQGTDARFNRLRIGAGRVSGGFPSGYGGGVFVEGTLRLTDCTLSGNTAFAGGGAYVANNGTASLTLNSSTVSGNFSDYGGGVQNEGTLTCRSSTFAENTAAQQGGAISAPFNKPVFLSHCTLAYNSADTGGGVAGGAISIANTILSGNFATTDPNVSGTLAASITSQVNATALLAPLNDYGGPTRTIALRPGSPARDAGTASLLTADQRGFAYVGAPDIGAYEAGVPNPNFNAYIWETLPVSAGLLQHLPTADYDGDGASNEAEWITGTAAEDVASVFRPVFFKDAAGLFMRFPTVTGRTYTIQRSSTLAAGSWTSTGLTSEGSGNTQTFRLPANSPGRWFFRVAVSR